MDEKILIKRFENYSELTYDRFQKSSLIFIFGILISLITRIAKIDLPNYSFEDFIVDFIFFSFLYVFFFQIESVAKLSEK